jgi:hypothetical protein
MKIPIVIFKCEWLKWEDNQGNPTYVQDDVGFFIVNFQYRLSMTSKPFIFPS